MHGKRVWDDLEGNARKKTSLTVLRNLVPSFVYRVGQRDERAVGSAQSFATEPTPSNPELGEEACTLAQGPDYLP